MTERLILALDQGTTNTKAIVLDAAGRVRAAASQRVSLEFPQPGWAQSNASEMWHGANHVINTCLDQLSGGIVDTIAIANQRESVVVWDRATGSPLAPVVSWQCTRGTAICETLSTEHSTALVAQRTGLQLDPMFSASKLRWLLDEIPDAQRRSEAGDLCAGTVDSWLLWHLADVHATDMTNASRTLLYGLDSNDWDDDLLSLFGIERAMLPEVRPSGDRHGLCSLRHPRLHLDAQVGAVLGDSHAALVGHGALHAGTVKASFGTGTSVMAPLPGIVRMPSLSATVAWSQRRGGDAIDIVHAVEGNIYATGSALEWTADLLGLRGDVSALEALARTTPTNGGVVFVPALAGLGAPHWDANARGTIVGLTRLAGPANIARAAFDAVAHQVADVIDELRTVPGCTPEVIRVDGGAMRSTLLATTVADIIGLPIECSQETELAAVGAAHLAGIQTGIWDGIEAIVALAHPHTRVEPELDDTHRQSERDRWRAALAQTRTRS